MIAGTEGASSIKEAQRETSDRHDLEGQCSTRPARHGPIPGLLAPRADDSCELSSIATRCRELLRCAPRHSPCTMPYMDLRKLRQVIDIPAVGTPARYGRGSPRCPH